MYLSSTCVSIYSTGKPTTSQEVSRNSAIDQSALPKVVTWADDVLLHIEQAEHKPAIGPCEINSDIHLNSVIQDIGMHYNMKHNKEGYIRTILHR